MGGELEARGYERGRYFLGVLFFLFLFSSPNIFFFFLCKGSVVHIIIIKKYLGGDNLNLSQRQPN